MRAGPLIKPVPAGVPLLDTAELERLQQIALHYRGRSRRTRQAPGPGKHHSLTRGQGMELYDVRPYQPGDDIRSMDWRATARSGRPTTKIFVEEHARRLFLLIDRRPTMMFGTRRELKAATAARVAAMLAFSALAERESVAGIVLDGTAHQFAPARTLEGLLPLLQCAAAPPPSPGATPRQAPPVQDATQTLFMRQTTQGATLYLISDFDDVANGRTTLADYLPLASSIHAVAIRIVDAAEQQLQEAGVLRLASPAGGRPVLVDTSNAALRQRYRERMAAREITLRSACARHNVPLYTISNQLELLAQLEPLL